jgi:prepilin-type N-terminal cleavage/methylation domain-containing protein
MKRGFTLTEFVIAVAIVGIMAAVAAPVYQSYILSARESAAKDNLRILRNLIEIYAIQHNETPPGYVENEPSEGVGSEVFIEQLVRSEVIAEQSSEEKIKRTGLGIFPQNPFNGKDAVLIIADGQEFPAVPVEPEFFGWVYKPAAKNIRVNWPGVDKEGVRYFDY